MVSFTLFGRKSGRQIPNNPNMLVKLRDRKQLVFKINYEYKIN